jgi:hypothetical protein
MCVINHSVSTVIGRHICSYIVGSGHFTVTRVINHSADWVFWSYINAYIVVSGHLPVMSVINHLVSAAVWSYINAYMVVSGHFNVTCVINHSVDWVFWSYINAYIVVSGHFTVTCAINRSGSTAIRRDIKTSIVCKVCKSFIKHSKLKRHLPIHIRDQPSSWDVCYKVLHFKHDLQSHFPVHGDVWAFMMDYSAGLRQTVHWLCGR